MGRPRKPDEIKRINGTDQPCRTNPAKPDYSIIVDAGPPPPELGEIGRDKFTQVTTEMINVGTLQAPDIDLVIMLCFEVELYFKAVEDIKKSMYVITRDAQKKPNPAIRIKSQTLRNIISLTAQLGLSPASRQKIISPKKQKKTKDAAAGLLG